MEKTIEDLEGNKYVVEAEDVFIIQEPRPNYAIQDIAEIVAQKAYEILKEKLEKDEAWMVPR